MSHSTTLTVRLSPEVKNRLSQLAERTRRTKSFLAGEAIADFVQRELEIVEAIERGRADARAGRVIPHDEAMDELDAVIEEAARSRT